MTSLLRRRILLLSLAIFTVTLFALGGQLQLAALENPSAAGERNGPGGGAPATASGSISGTVKDPSGAVLPA